MKKIILLFLIFKIYSCIHYNTFEIDDFVQKINNVEYKESDYKMIITSIINLLDKYYVFLDYTAQIKKKKFGNVDLIKELNNINITNTTSYLEFYNYIQTIISKARDRHLKIKFNNISQYSVFSPIKLYIESMNDENLLFFKINYELSIYFDLQNIDFLKDFTNKPIKLINGLDPYEFLLYFPYKDLKDDHAQFTRNLKEFEGGNIEFPFIPSKFQGITFEFEGGRKISISYKVFIPDSMTPEFKSYYLNELENYKNNIFQPSILDTTKI